MTAENWKLQVSIKAQNGDLINVRANTADELSVLLEGIADYSTQVAATSKAIGVAYNVAPLSTGGSTPATTPSQSSAPTQAAAPLSSPTCVHGARIFKQGVAKATGKPYAMWVCPQPMGADQCKPVN